MTYRRDHHKSVVGPVPIVVDRTPCCRCGVRADRGCAHVVPSWVGILSAMGRAG